MYWLFEDSGGKGLDYKGAQMRLSGDGNVYYLDIGNDLIVA